MSGATIRLHPSPEHEYVTANISDGSSFLTPNDLISNAISGFVSSGALTFQGSIHAFINNNYPEVNVSNMTRESRKRCEDELLKQFEHNLDMDGYQVDITFSYSNSISNILIRSI